MSDFPPLRDELKGLAPYGAPQLDVPVKLVGLGEGADDLAPFDPSGFVDALLGES